MDEKRKIKIDEKEYIIDELSNEAKIQVQNILYVNNKITDLQSQIAILNAAKEHYLNILRNLLKAHEESNNDDEKIKFN